MKRLLLPTPASAAAWWETNPNALKADCFVISLPNGQTIYATEGQWDITFNVEINPVPGAAGTSTTFKALTYGRWSRGKIVSEAGFKCAANNMTLSVVPKIGAMYPGLNIGILNAALNHLFDGAHVWVYTAYMPFGGYGNVQVVETKWQGWILKSPGIGRLLCQFDCGDPFFLLNQKVPSRLMQSNCPWSFGDDPTGADGRCAVNPANYTVGFTASAASSSTALTPVTAFTQADGYFTQGVVTCVTGANAGLSQTVKSHVGGIITSVVPWLLPVAAGDTFSAIKGCDQTPTTCAGLTQANGTVEPGNWQTRFGGTPFVPPPSTSI
jgi:hypothetical protein